MNDRRTGKTTWLCAQIASQLASGPGDVMLTGPYVIINLSMYRKMLREAGADPNRVRLVSVSSVHTKVMGFRGKLFVDDYDDLTDKSRENVDTAMKINKRIRDDLS